MHLFTLDCAAVPGGGGQTWELELQHDLMCTDFGRGGRTGQGELT